MLISIIVTFQHLNPLRVSVAPGAFPYTVKEGVCTRKTLYKETSRQLGCSAKQDRDCITSFLIGRQAMNKDYTMNKETVYYFRS